VPGPAEKHKALKNLLGEAIDEGEWLRRSFYKENGEWHVVGQVHIKDWVDRTCDLIEAALDKPAAQSFLDNTGFSHEDLDVDVGPEGWSRLRHERYLRSLRVKRLHELALRVKPDDIDPNFDPEEWKGHFKTE
jgi:hypothetical protein